MHQSFRLLLAIGSVTAFFPIAARAQNKITAGKIVQVSVDRAAKAHNEVMIAADPGDPNRLLAASHISLTGQIGAAVYLSLDGGLTWKVTMDSVPGADPALAFGPNHTAYYASLAGNVYRSADGGLTWESSAFLQNPGAPKGKFAFDREYLLVDLDKKSPHFGTIYMNGTLFISPENVPKGKYLKPVSAAALYTSRDGGKTWGNPVFRPVFEPSWVIGMANSVMLSSGAVVTLFGIRNDSMIMAPPSRNAPPNSTINVAIAEPGGADVIQHVEIGSFQMGLADHSRNIPASLIPWLAVDPGSAVFTDRLYAVWPDARTERSRVMFSYSSDSGRTWSQPALIDGPGDMSKTGPDALIPTIAVNKEGVVVAAWYSRSEVDGKAKWEMRSTASFDGGETWQPSIVVADGLLPSIDADTAGISSYASGAPSSGKSGDGVISLWANYESEDLHIGDTGGLTASADGRFHLAWIDRRTGVAQIFSAPITATGPVARNGGGELASYMDLGGYLQLKVVRTKQDQRTKRVTFTARLKNTTKDTIKGPIKIRALGATSGQGKVRIVNAANGLDGAGAIWDFSSAIPATGLLPDTESGEQVLTFEFEQLGALTRWWESGGLLNFTARILGPRQTIRAAAK